MVNVKSSMLIFVAFAVISEVTVALLPPFAYTAAQAIMDKMVVDQKHLEKGFNSSRTQQPHEDLSGHQTTLASQKPKMRRLRTSDSLQHSTPLSTSADTSHPSEVNADKIIGVGGLGGLYPALHKLSKCHYNGSIYDNGDIVDSQHPCNKCKCHHGQVSCYWQQCNGSPDSKCIPLFVPGNCCPLYSCENNFT